jgi:hypothetical protein
MSTVRLAADLLATGADAVTNGRRRCWVDDQIQHLVVSGVESRRDKQRHSHYLTEAKE